MIDPTPGCRFRRRCPFAVDVCETVTPELVELAPRHAAACHVAAADAGLGELAVRGRSAS